MDNDSLSGPAEANKKSVILAKEITESTSYVSTGSLEGDIWKTFSAFQKDCLKFIDRKPEKNIEISILLGSLATLLGALKEKNINIKLENLIFQSYITFPDVSKSQLISFFYNSATNSSDSKIINIVKGRTDIEKMIMIAETLRVSTLEFLIHISEVLDSFFKGVEKFASIGEADGGSESFLSAEGTLEVAFVALLLHVNLLDFMREKNVDKKQK